MDRTAPIGRPRRGFRRWKWLAAISLALVCVGFWLSNLILTSGWIRHKIEQKIDARIGLTSQLHQLTWSPWNGILAKGITLSQPAPLRAIVAKPLAQIAAIQIAPVWSAWLRGKLEIQTVTLDTPEFTVPIELIAHLVRPQPFTRAAAPPAVTAPPTPPAVALPTNALPPVPPTTVEKPKAPAPLAAHPTGWLKLKNASFTLVSGSSPQPLFELKNATGSLPIAGEPAQSSVTIHSIALLGQPVISSLTAKLNWQPPALALQPLEIEFSGSKILAAGQLGMLGGLPFQFAAKLNPQPLTPQQVPFNGSVQAASISAQTAIRGLLAAPTTWQGDFLAEASTISLMLASHNAKFERASSVTVLRNGVLSCVDARCLSDELSLLGNATLLADGRAAAVVRLVAPPETLAAIIKQGTPNAPPPALTPLSSPQRAALDLQAFGRLGQFFLQLGTDGPIISLKP